MGRRRRRSAPGGEQHTGEELELDGVGEVGEASPMVGDDEAE